MIYLIPLIFFLIVAAHALIDAYQIEKKGIYINHFQEGCYYAIICGFCGLTILLIQDISWWPLIIFPIVTRMAFFDVLLNLFRGKKFLYEGTRSLIDRIEKILGLPTWFLRILYFGIYTGYTIYYYVSG